MVCSGSKKNEKDSRRNRRTINVKTNKCFNFYCTITGHVEKKKQAEHARVIKRLYSKDLIGHIEGKKLCWISRCGWNDIIEMDTNAVVIKVRMSLFGWRLEQVDDFCDYDDRLLILMKQQLT